MFNSLFDFYHSKEWMSMVKLIRLDRVNSDGELICEHCGKPIVQQRDCIGHHSVPLTLHNVNDYAISLNPALIKLLHFKCHNIEHNRFGLYLPQKVFLVYGSPLSGKTKWVLDNKGGDDLVVDMDMLHVAVTGAEMYDKSDKIKSNVFMLRDCLLDQIKTRFGNWQNAFVIGGYPQLTERERVAKVLGAETIFMNEEKMICLERLYSDPQRKNVITLWEKYINDWFMTYQPDIIAHPLL